ncbi:MAG: hypothetical protein RXR43_12845 [Sulfolobus sp.]
MVSSTISIDKFFIVRVHGYIPKTTPTIAVTYITLYVRVKDDKFAHANLLCIRITDGYNTINISTVADNEFIKKHRDLMANSNLNVFKFGIYFIFDDAKNNVTLEWKDGKPILKLYKKIYLFIEPFDPEKLDELQKRENDQEAINYFRTKFDGECRKLDFERDEKSLKVFWLVYNREGKGKELEFKEENGEITILGLKQTKESGGK